MKVIEATGLVPVKATAPHPSGLVMVGDIIGVLPARAKAYVDLGIAELVEIPDGVETETLSDVEAEVVELSDAAIAGKTDWRKMKFLSRYKLAVDSGYDGEKAGEPVKAFLEVKFPAA